MLSSSRTIALSDNGGNMEPDNFQQNQAERNEIGQFVPGQSGNPAGRTPGSRNHATVLAEQLFDGASGALANKAVEMALAGDAAALPPTPGRLIPPRPHPPAALALPAPVPAAACPAA